MPRCSLLIIVNEPTIESAIERVLELSGDYVDAIPDMEVERQELYAFGSVERIRPHLRPPQPLSSTDSAETELGPVHAIWDGNAWLTPGTCWPAPPDDNGANAWQWTHYNAVMNAAATGFMALWDLEVAFEAAA